MLRTVKRTATPCDSPVCVAMAIFAGILATIVVVYSSAQILLLLR